ncbi:MAG: hypothetical protein RLZZ436_1065 [Planctomycetota bacterium]
MAQGDQLKANQLQLLGDAYRVEGSGSAKLDGSNLGLTLCLVRGGGRTLP